MRDWIFSAKTFLAAMLALYIAFYFDLPRPYWALATVYIVSNPFVGATRSKALYRALGTLIGAAAAVVLVPPFVDTPLLLSAMVALWLVVFLYLAISTRTARTYVFMLASYTLPIVAFAAVDHPGAVFDIATSRVEEIFIGLVCSSVVGSVVFPNPLAPTIAKRNESWFAEAMRYASLTIHGDAAESRGSDGTDSTTHAALAQCRKTLATHVRGMEVLLSQLAYDHASPRVLRYSEALHGRMQLVLPLMSSLGDSLAAFRHHGVQQNGGGYGTQDGAILESAAKSTTESAAASPNGHAAHEAIEALLARFETWFCGRLDMPASVPSDRVRDPEAVALFAAIAALEPVGLAMHDDADAGIDTHIDTPPAHVAEVRDWEAALMSHVLWRLRNLVEIWLDCKRLRIVIALGHGEWHPRYRHVQVGAQHHYLDRTNAFFSACAASLVIFVSTCLWIFTGWQDGGAAVSLGAVACGLFAASDEPASMIMIFFTSACLAILLAIGYFFVILPNVSDFPLLVAFLALVFIPLGCFMPRPKVALAALLTALMAALSIGINDTYDNNVSTFLQSNIATIAGILFAAVMTSVIRPFGTPLIATRLVRSSWRDIAAHAVSITSNGTDAIGLKAQRAMHGRMLDRLMQLIPRTAADAEGARSVLAGLQDMRVGLNMVALRRRAQKHSDGMGTLLDAIVAATGRHFRDKLAGNDSASRNARADGWAASPGSPAAPTLMSLIDRALEQVMNAAPDLSRKQRTDILHCLVGLRLSLFPQALAPSLSPKSTPTPKPPLAHTAPRKKGQ